jgi:MuDR family transposase
MQAAREAIQRYILDDGESCRTEKAEKKRYILLCKDTGCTFHIRVSNLDKKGPAIIVYTPHTCSAIHYKNKNAHSVKCLIEHHRSSVIDNRHITAAQIRSNKRLNFNDDITYKQAYCTIQAILAEMYSDEAESFAKFPAHVLRP